MRVPTKGEGRVATARAPKGGRAGHHRGRLYTAARLLALQAIVAGTVLAAPTLIQATGWGRDHRVASAETATVPAPAAGSASDLMNGAGPAAQLTDGPVNGVDFEIMIPSLGYRATVLEGTGDGVLAQGPGHYVSTAWPGQTGNVGVAAHNTYWMALGNLRPGDRVDVQGHHGLFTYAIRSITIVNPDDRTVLAPTDDHRLTMTTCYPLWAGAWATQRMIFTAFQVDTAG